MAEVMEAVRLTDSSKLPDELSGFEGLGKNEKGHLVGVYEDGDTKGIGQLGSLLMKTLVGLGAAEEIVPEPESPEVAALKARVEELEVQLDQERGEHIAELQALRDEFEEQLKQRDRRIDELEARLDSKDPDPPAAKPIWIKDNLGRRMRKEEGFYIRRPEPASPGPTPIPEPAPDDERRRVAEEETVWYRRGPAVAVLGGLATAAAVAATGFAIWNHHELGELEHRQPSPAAEIIPDNGFGSPSVLESKGYHLTYYNQAHGRKVTGVWVPKDVNLVGSPGNYRLVKDGKVLVKRVKWDSQGKLIRSNMTELRKNYDVGWSFLKGDRKVSIVLNR